MYVLHQDIFVMIFRNQIELSIEHYHRDQIYSDILQEEYQLVCENNALS